MFFDTPNSFHVKVSSERLGDEPPTRGARVSCPARLCRPFTDDRHTNAPAITTSNSSDTAASGGMLGSVLLDGAAGGASLTVAIDNVSLAGGKIVVDERAPCKFRRWARQFLWRDDTHGW